MELLHSRWRYTARMAGSSRRRRADGAVTSALVCTPFSLALIFLTVKAAQHHEWGRLAGFILIAGIFLAIPAGGMKWLSGALKVKKPPDLPLTPT